MSWLRISSDRDSIPKIAALVTFGIASACYASSRIASYRQRQAFKERRRVLRQCRDDGVETLNRRLGQERDSLKREIVEIDVTELLEKLQKGEVKAADVLKVYQEKALRTHERTNCLTQCLLEANDMAEERDRKVESKGLLHGLPVSLKDNLFVKGYVSSKGVCRLADQVAQEDCILVQVLKSQGAVPYVMTGFPQLFLSYECSNPIYGNVKNPHDLARGPGGSSGGEGALIGGGGSILGFGTDFGGSIRCPSAFCGICGLKPTANRITFAYPPSGQGILIPSAGPMSRNVEGLAVAMKAVLVPEMFQKDPLCPPIPFRDEIYRGSESLTVGFFTDNGVCPVSPASARAVMVAKEALERAGHRVVPWTPPKAAFAVHALCKCVAGDRGYFISKLLEDDEIDPSVWPFIYSVLASRLRRFMLYAYQKYWKGHHILAEIISSLKGVGSVAEWWALTTEVTMYRKEFSDEWHSNQFDAVLSPAFAFPALKYLSSNQYNRSGSYLNIYNLMDLPAGVLPVTRVTSQDILDLQNWTTGDDVGDYVRKDQQDAEGLPVAVQVAAARWQEETCLRVMREIEKQVQFK